ncbi:hypothetical protein [Streptomyces sp. NPDC090022]|uniref:hypothetical protein n=1 Tax=Streptomyces sp. NPDC090022 TaxID=3365920 RepID=UPI0037F195EF
MNPKQLVARTIAVALPLAFVTTMSVGAYHDVGGWLAVAALWGAVIGCVCAVAVFVWAVDNWNTR